VSGLVGWLAEQVDEDERRIEGCCHCGYPVTEISDLRWTHDGPWQGRRCPRRITGALPNPEPDQARREVAFKRALLARFANDGSTEAAVERGDISAAEYVTSQIEGLAVLRLLGEVYSERPGYAEAIR